jgi:urease beta subunit
MLRNLADPGDAGVFHGGIGVQPFGDRLVDQGSAFFFEELDEALFFGDQGVYGGGFAIEEVCDRLLGF